MGKWWKTLVGAADEGELAPSEAIPPGLARDRALQTLRLELQEREREVSRLKELLEQQQARGTEQVEAAGQAQLESLLADISVPLTLLLAQQQPGGETAAAERQLGVARQLLDQLVRSLADHGWQPYGTVGQMVDYDPDRHQPLSETGGLTTGQPVLIRWPGATYHGRIVRKAGVTAGGSEEAIGPVT